MSAHETVPLLELSAVRKSYGSNHVLHGIDLAVARGEVRALLGENGAGKSTLVNIIGGAIASGDFDGTIRLDGDEIAVSSPLAAERLGICQVTQELAVVPELSVVENLFLNRQPRRGGLVDRRAALQTAVRLAEGIGLSLEDIDLTAPIKLLSPAQQQMICILRALMGEVRLLILDEPTSRLSETETAQLFDRIGLLRAQGISVLYISHRLAEVRRIADTVTVLRDGLVCLNLDAANEFDERRIVESMTGQRVDALYPDRSTVPSTTESARLEVRDLTVVRPSTGRVTLQATSFDVAAGEILGVFGAVGSGTNALALALTGASTDRVAGTVRVAGRPLTARSTAAAVAAGVGYVSGDPTEGTFGAMSVEENLLLVARTADVPRPWARGASRRRAATARRLADDVAVRCQGLRQSAGELSGGNRQKVALARWLPAQPRVLVMEDPTRGVDVGARRDVYRSLHAIVEEGLAIVLISSDLDEVVGLADRGLVLRQGQIVSSWSRETADADTILHDALSGAGRPGPILETA